MARYVEAAGSMTRTGMIVGTPEFMAPEQARGGRELSPAADIFALGCVLYECLCGDPPFVAEHIAAVLVRILFEDPVPIAVRLPGIAVSVSRLLEDMLKKEAAQRIVDATALCARLAALGKISELSLPLTVAAPVRMLVSTFAAQEQVLFSLVVAVAPQLEDRTARLGDRALTDASRRAALLSAVRMMGARAEYLMDGALVVTVSPNGSAQDQATLAARVALVIKERWSEAEIAVTTGRGAASGGTAVGEVADRAVQLLLRRTSLPRATPSDSAPGVWIDELSARLLGAHFQITHTLAGALLIGEEREVDGTRPLLGKPTPCVGRDVELGNLEAQLASCIEESESRAVLITAPPGIGKSRLRHEFLRRVATRHASLTQLLSRGERIGAGAPYAMLVAALRRLCGIAGSEPREVQAERLRERLMTHVVPADKERVLLFLAEMCEVPFSAEGRPMLQAARQDPKLLRDGLRRAFIDWLRAECQAAPVLIVLDDLQWGDGLTVALLDEALAELVQSPLFVVALARPEVHLAFPRLWHGRGSQEIPLKPLSKKACARLIAQVLGNGVAAAAIAHAVEQSAGNALFLEELIRSIAEGKAEERSETVIAMLQARIGRLGAVPRRVLRAAAVFGQTFWIGGVARLLDLAADSRELQRAISSLVEGELIEPQAQSRLGEQAQYSFRHAAVRDAAYSLLTDEDIATGHRLAADFLEAAGESDPAIIAEHCERGGALVRAVQHFIRAADLAAANNDLDSVLKRSERGIACGASGEALGILRSLQAAAHAWQDAWGPACACGVEAAALLVPGSLRFCKLMIPLFLATSGADPQAFGALAQRFPTIEPEPAARSAYAEAAAWLVLAFSMIGQRAPAAGFLMLVNMVSGAIDKEEAAVWAQIRLAQGFNSRFLEPDPWNSLLLFQSGAHFAELALDVRNLVFINCLVGSVQSELGDAESAEKTLRDGCALAERIAVPLAIAVSGLYLSLHLSRGTSQKGHQEAEMLARRAIASKHVNPFVLGQLHGILAHVLLQLGELEAAEFEARIACESLAMSITLRLQPVATYMQLLMRLARAKEARELGERELEALLTCGGVGYSEVGFLLALAEARDAVGDHDAACSAITQARARMQLRADRIPDAAARQNFFDRVSENRRICELVKMWNTPEIAQ